MRLFDNICLTLLVLNFVTIQPFYCSRQQRKVQSAIVQRDSLHGNLFDQDVTSCIDSDKALDPLNYYIVEMNISQKLDRGIITVFLSRYVQCSKRHVMNIWKEAPQCRSRYVKSCDLLSSVNRASTSCKYQCSCPDDVCTVVMVDHRVEFEQEPADICEVTYE